LFACNNFPPLGYNIIFYCNQALDKLFAQEQATTDPGVRQQLFIQIHRIYLTQFPFIVLHSREYWALPYKSNHNYEPGPFSRGKGSGEALETDQLGESRNDETGWQVAMV
jgi:ABC-type transport system substrate-binding protein